MTSSQSNNNGVTVEGYKVALKRVGMLASKLETRDCKINNVSYKILIVNCDNDTDLQKIRNCDFNLILENDEDDDKLCAIIIPSGGKNNFRFSFTTKTSYQVELAHFIIGWLADKFGIDIDKQQGMVISLHEAIMNAIFHGNLGLSGGYKDFDGFVEHYREAEEKVGQIEYSNKRINIDVMVDDSKITFIVENEGDSFDTTNIRKSDKAKPTGRGILLIKSFATKVEYLDGGRKLLMEFVR